MSNSYSIVLGTGSRYLARCICVVVLLLTPFGYRSASAATRSDASTAFPMLGIPDPSIIQVADSRDYYIVCSGQGIPIWHSRDLKSWVQVGRIFETAVPEWARKRVPGSRNVWAPDIKHVGDKYYVYYSVSTPGSQRSVIGLAINTTFDSSLADYHWEDRGLILESAPGQCSFNAIDPALLIDAHGDGYLFWGSYWDGIKAGKVDLHTGRLLSDPSEAVAIARRRPRACRGIEGAYPIRHAGYYYLFVSWDHTFADTPANISYKVMVGRSRNPLGPYVDRDGVRMTDGGGTLVVMGDERWRGPGHNSVLQTPAQDWLVHHVVDAKHPEAGRILQLRPLVWRNGWPEAGQPLGSRCALPTDPAAKRVVSRWEHVVDGKVHYDIFLEANGLISGTAGRARWQLDGNDLLLKWKSPKAPGGWWIDRVHLAPSGDAYRGTNQKGVAIQGRRRR